MEKYIEQIQNINLLELAKTGLSVVLTVVIGWIMLKTLSRSLKHLEKRMVRNRIRDGETPTESGKRVQTLMRLIRQGTSILIWSIIILIILDQLGIKIGPILAGAGILGLAVGFGAQNLVRDFIAGFFIILENQIRVGDVAVINGTAGLVEEINFRTTSLRDLSGILHIFPNGAINTLSNMTNDWSAYVFNVGVAYKENTDRVSEVIGEVLETMKNDPKFESVILDYEIFGVNELGDSSVVIKGRIRTRPSQQWSTGREFLRRIKLRFDELDIEIPFPHQTLYFGEASKAFDLRVLEKISEKNSG